MPRKDLSIVFVCGGGVSLSAAVLSFPGDTPCGERVWPRYCTVSVAKMHFLRFSFKLWSWKRWSTLHKWITWETRSGECTNPSSMYVRTFGRFSTTLSIRRLNVAGLPESPMAATFHRHCPDPGMVKAEKSRDDSASGSCQKEELRSRAENTLDLEWPTSARQESTDRMLYLSGRDCWLIMR
jgi:hypothetical protein